MDAPRRCGVSSSSERLEEELGGLDGHDKDLGRGDPLDVARVDDAADGVVGDEDLVAEQRPVGLYRV